MLAGLRERPYFQWAGVPNYETNERLPTNAFSKEVGRPLKNTPMKPEKSTLGSWEAALQEAEYQLERQQENVARLKAAIKVFRSNLKNKVPWPDEADECSDVRDFKKPAG